MVGDNANLWFPSCDYRNGSQGKFIFLTFNNKKTFYNIKFFTFITFICIVNLLALHISKRKVRKETPCGLLDSSPGWHGDHALIYLNLVSYLD